MRERTFQKDEVIFREGEMQTTMFDIRSGRVGIVAKYGTGAQRTLVELGPGQFFGEMGMVDAYPRSATAVALEDGTVVRELQAQEFGVCIREQPEQVLAVMRNLSSRLRDLTAEYRDVCGVIAELEQAGQDAGAKQVLLSALGKKLARFARVYNESAAIVAQSNDAFYWNMMMSSMY